MIPIADLDTPALLVDVPRLDHNIATMQRLADRCGVALRPHTKTHKAPAIARRQLVAGARGLTVAKVGEAEVLVAAGCEDLLIAYPLIGTVKYERLARLLDRATIRVAADSPAGVAALSAFFGPRGHQLPVLIEVDTGFRRTGVQTADEALALAAAVAAAPGLVFGGLLEFSGQTYGACSEAERRTLGQAAGSRLVEIGQHLAARGLPPPVLSTGATPALPASAEVAGITEIRPGVYVFGDLKQVELGTIRREQCALTVLATVVSQRQAAISWTAARRRCPATITPSGPMASSRPTPGWRSPGPAKSTASSRTAPCRSTSATK